MPAAGVQILAELAAHWPSIAGISLLGALLSLDETAVAQTWLSQPLPAGTLAGLVAGDPASGVALGLPLQLATLGNLPVGQFFTGERVAPLLGAVAAVVLHGGLDRAIPSFVEPLADPRPGWLLLAIVVGSIVGNRVVSWERRFHSRIVAGGLRSLKDGTIGKLERAHRRCLWLTAVRGLLGTTAWTLLFAFAWMPLLSLLPQPVPRALGLLPLLTPAMAVGAMLELRGPGSGLSWMALGFVLVLVVELIAGGVV